MIQNSSSEKGVVETDLTNYSLPLINVRRPASASGTGIDEALEESKIKRVSHNDLFSKFNNLSAAGSGMDNVSEEVDNVKDKRRTKSNKPNESKKVFVEFMKAVLSSLKNIDTNTTRLAKIDKIIDLLNKISNTSASGSKTKDLSNKIDNFKTDSLKLAGVEAKLNALINDSGSSDTDQSLDDLISALESMASE
jgi:hypothetical protein